MSADPVETWLRETIGLAPESVGRGMVERAVARGLAESGAGSRADYAKRLRVEPALARALIAEVVVPETWFFRDVTPFEIVRAEAPRLQAAAAGRPLRLLSLPCSTGEEACSLAIACLEAGLAAGEFRIDARDLNPAVLARARDGVYGTNSFRGADDSRRARWFFPEPAPAGASPRLWRVAPDVLAAIDYAEGNALEFDATKSGGDYDFIFCRNLLIYLEPEVQREVLRRLIAALAPGGVLCVGHAEAALALEAGLAPWPVARGFAFTRPVASVSPPRAKPEWRQTLPPMPNVSRTVSTRTSPPIPSRTPLAVPLAAVSAGAPDLETGMRLADAGRLSEAADLAKARLAAVGPEAGAYYLLGLAQDAGGDPAAAEAAYRKALYLEPRHAEALAHLAALLENRGDLAGARRLRERARLAVADEGGGA